MRARSQNANAPAAPDAEGPAKLRIPLLLAATVINIKRLTAPTGENTTAGDDNAARVCLIMMTVSYTHLTLPTICSV